MKIIFTIITIWISTFCISSAKELFKMSSEYVTFSSLPTNFVSYFPNKMESLSDTDLTIHFKKKYLIPKPIEWDATFDFASHFYKDTVISGEFILPANDYIITVLQFYPNNTLGHTKSQVDFWVENNDNDTTIVIFDYTATNSLSIEDEMEPNSIVSIYNLSGILVYNNTLPNIYAELALLPPGIYLLEYYYKHEKKVVKIIN